MSQSPPSSTRLSLSQTLKTSRIARSLSSVKLSSTAKATRLFLQKQLWAWPLIAAVVLGVTGFWVNRTIEIEMKSQIKSTLETILNADVSALRQWFETVKHQAESLAMDPTVEETTRDLISAADADPRRDIRVFVGSKPEADLRKLLTERVQALGYVDFFVVDPQYRVIGATDDAVPKRILKNYQKEFAEKIFTSGASVSLPHPSIVLLKDAQGRERPGVPTMFAAAPITLEGQKKPLAALFLRIRPEQTFTALLQVARSGKTGETYAFNKNGLLLSQSRFDDEMKRIGLLADREGEASILTLELRNPGVNMMEGQRPPLLRAQQPLTELARSATSGETGSNVEGYLDYRGVPNLGAWTWLKDLDFGVATEIDRAEAYRPLDIIRTTFRAIFALLTLAAIAIFAFMILLAKQKRALQDAALTARQLGQYRLEEKIGSGGMGAVYRARHALLRRPTAIKMLDVDKISPSAVARFEREVQLTSALNHPNTIAIYDYGHTPEGLFYYAMEYLDGIDLENLVARFGAQPDGRVIEILQQVCGSLSEAHGVGLVHRDIKPANIILNRRGGQTDVAKVLDFGLVKSVGSDHEANLTAANSLTGTPLYLSPEAIETPDAVDYRTDIYAVGAVGYFLLTGGPVFTGKSIVEICMHHVKTAPEPPSKRSPEAISPRLESLLLRCLAKKRDDRPESAQAIIDELSACAPCFPWPRSQAEEWWDEFAIHPFPRPPIPSPSTVSTEVFGETVDVVRASVAIGGPETLSATRVEVDPSRGSD